MRRRARPSIGALAGAIVLLAMAAASAASARADDFDPNLISPAVGWASLKSNCSALLRLTQAGGAPDLDTKSQAYREQGACDGYLLGALSNEHYMHQVVGKGVVDPKRPAICTRSISPMTLVKTPALSFFIAGWWDQIDKSRFGPLRPISDRTYDMALTPFRAVFPCPLKQGAALPLPATSNLYTWCSADEAKTDGTDRAVLGARYLRAICEGLVRAVIEGTDAYMSAALAKSNSNEMTTALRGAGFCLPAPSIAIGKLADGFVHYVERAGVTRVANDFVIATLRLYLKKTYPCT